MGPSEIRLEGCPLEFDGGFAFMEPLTALSSQLAASIETSVIASLVLF